MKRIATLARLGIDHDELVWKILDQSPDCIKVLSLDGSLEYMNPNGQAAMEIEDFSLIAGARLADLWPEESRPLLITAIARAAGGEKDRFKGYCPTAKGAPRWWEVSTSPICDRDGRPIYVLCTSRDITFAERPADASVQRPNARSAAGELAHRTRNQLSVINALARVSLGSGDVAGRERLMERIGAVSTAIDALAEAGDSVTARLLVSRILNPIAGEPHFRLHSVPDAHLGGEVARTVALVLAELLSNTQTHGAFSGTGGNVDLRVEHGGDRLDFVWTEALDHMPSTPPVSGTGLRLVERLSAILTEPARIEWGNRGLSVTFSATLTEAVAA